MFDYIAFDTETTGTSPAQDVIIEIGAVKFSGGKPVDSYNQLIDPGRPIPADSIRIHGITDEMVTGKPGIEEALNSFADFCGGDVLVAHNAGFDVKFVSAAAIECDVVAPTGVVLDTYKIAKSTLPDLLNHRLETLVKHFNLGNEGFHRATDDARYCGQIFLRLLLNLKDKGGRLKFQNLVNLSGGMLKFPEIVPKAKQIALL